MISVCINTKNRPQHLSACLKSLRQNKFKDFEIIVVDQSNKTEVINANKKLTSLSSKISYFQSVEKGVGRAKNYALSRVRGKIIAFTDDDCLVDKNWIRNIVFSFARHKNIMGIFGEVLPFKPELHRGQICPCTFTYNKERIISQPELHWQNIGFGNNMAFRKEIFDKIGYFRNWLGPGSIGSNAEEAEFALRGLIKGYKLLYNQKVVVYHNRWLTKEEYQRQCLSYSCGETACYGYFAFQGKVFAKKVLVSNLKDSYWKLRKSLKMFLSFKNSSWRFFLNTLEEFTFRFRGLLVAIYFSKKEPINYS